MSFLQPEITINAFDITPGMKIADFGCGAGHWALAFAKRTGAGGAVYAIDVQEEALESVRSRAHLEHIHTVETIRADLEKPRASTLGDDTVDFVLLSNILFQAEHKEAIIQEGWRILKKGGRAALVEWDETAKLGPPLRQRIIRQDAEHLMKKTGFAFEKEFSAGSHHYGLLFRKPLA